MSDKPRPPPIHNQLLAALPGKDYKRLLPQLESVPLPFMGVLYDSGDALRWRARWAHTFSLDDIKEAYDLFGKRAEGVLKVVIKP